MPAAAGDPAQPGTASTSRPRSSAWSAVMSAPERARASTTRTASRAPRSGGFGPGTATGRAVCPARTPRGRARSRGCGGKAGVRARVRDIGAAAQHRDGGAIGFERAKVTGRVDAERHAADDAHPGAAAYAASRRARASAGAPARRAPTMPSARPGSANGGPAAAPIAKTASGGSASSRNGAGYAGSERAMQTIRAQRGPRVRGHPREVRAAASSRARPGATPSASSRFAEARRR